MPSKRNTQWREDWATHIDGAVKLTFANGHLDRTGHWNSEDFKIFGLLLAHDIAIGVCEDVGYRFLLEVKLTFANGHMYRIGHWNSKDFKVLCLLLGEDCGHDREVNAKKVDALLLSLSLEIAANGDRLDSHVTINVLDVGGFPDDVDQWPAGNVWDVDVWDVDVLL